MLQNLWNTCVKKNLKFIFTPEIALDLASDLIVCKAGKLAMIGTCHEVKLFGKGRGAQKDMY